MDICQQSGERKLACNCRHTISSDYQSKSRVSSRPWTFIGFTDRTYVSAVGQSREKHCERKKRVRRGENRVCWKHSNLFISTAIDATRSGRFNSREISDGKNKFAPATRDLEAGRGRDRGSPLPKSASLESSFELRLQRRYGRVYTAVTEKDYC